MIPATAPIASKVIPYQMKTERLMTDFAAKIDQKQPLKEYPRPHMTRPDWHSLNGIWQCEQDCGGLPPHHRPLGREVLVPYPVESALSGIKESWENIWYKRSFKIPANFKERVLLHFEAVDWQAEVYLNGSKIGIHKGGFDSFSFDITDLVDRNNHNEVLVRVWDPTDQVAIANGKQNRSRFNNPNSMWYSPSSGIWQPVWLESVPSTYIADLQIASNIDDATIEVTADLEGAEEGLKKRVTVLDGGVVVAKKDGPSKQPCQLVIKDPKLWSPESPHLYDVKVELLTADGKVLDEVGSYCGMRKISLGKDETGKTKLLLNNKPYFHMAVLDQGYWPDGVYTAPTDEALKSDLVRLKELGFNTSRKHMKIEPERWYYWADKLGVLVWQDMPAATSVVEESPFKEGRRDHLDRFPGARDQWKKELTAMIKNHKRHPSVALWVLFNERWGQPDDDFQKEVTALAKKLDPSRPVTANSSAFEEGDSMVGDVNDYHHYPDPRISRYYRSAQARVNGEFGGYVYGIKNHAFTAPKDLSWVKSVKDKETLIEKYREGMEQVVKLESEGASGAVYTQLTDVEGELNGLITYDRKINKFKDQLEATRNVTQRTWIKG